MRCLSRIVLVYGECFSHDSLPCPDLLDRMQQGEGWLKNGISTSLQSSNCLKHFAVALLGLLSKMATSLSERITRLSQHRVEKPMHRTKSIPLKLLFCAHNRELQQLHSAHNMHIRNLGVGKSKLSFASSDCTFISPSFEQVHDGFIDKKDEVSLLLISWEIFEYTPCVWTKFLSISTWEVDHIISWLWKVSRRDDWIFLSYKAMSSFFSL